MKIIIRGSAIFIFAVCLLGVAEGRSSHHHRTQAQSGQAGVFDYYVLTMSWSPEFCHSHGDSPECEGGHYGFIVHGLWPQYTNGYPENCSSAPGLADPSRMTDIMPDVKLVEHEWTTHGTCSGLDAEAYFKRVREAFGEVHIPAKLAAPKEAMAMSPGQVKDEFLRANPKLSREQMTVSCGNNYLTAVSVCMTKTLEPRACGELRDCRANSVRIPPVR